MSTILIVEDDAEVSEILCMYLESEFEEKIIQSFGGFDAIEKIKENDDIVLIISDYQMPNGNGADLYSYLKETNNDLPFIFFSGFPYEDYPELQGFLEDNPKNSYIMKPFEGEVMNQAVIKALNTQLQSEVTGFKRININRFDNFNKIEINIYLRKPNGDFVHLTNDEDGYIDKMVTKYKEKGINDFFTPDSDYEQYQKLFNERLLELLSKPKLDFGERIEVQLDSIDNVHQCLKSMGIPDQVLGLARQNIEVSIKTIKSNRKISSILGKIIKNKNYVTEIALVTGYLASSMCTQMEWNSKSTMEKVSMASLLMDISIPDEKLARIVSKESPEFKLLTPEDQDLVLNHGFRSYELAEDIAKHYPSDFKTLLEQHHERPTGLGFPKGLDKHNITPLTSIFIFAHNFAHQLINPSPLKIENLRDALSDIEENYSQHKFFIAHEAFVKIFRPGKTKRKQT